jgi:hypothetical protein
VVREGFGEEQARVLAAGGGDFGAARRGGDDVVVFWWIFHGRLPCSYRKKEGRRREVAGDLS